MKIIATTDGKYVGSEIDIEHIPITLGDGVLFVPDHIITIPNGKRLYNTNYVIDVQEQQ